MAADRDDTFDSSFERSLRGMFSSKKKAAKRPSTTSNSNLPPTTTSSIAATTSQCPDIVGEETEMEEPQGVDETGPDDATTNTTTPKTFSQFLIKEDDDLLSMRALANMFSIGSPYFDEELKTQSFGRVKIFNKWPRDPKGVNIMDPDRISANVAGKMTPSGLHWGANLWNWCWYNRVPEIPGFQSKATTSQLAKWMREHGELFADVHLMLADEEPDPELLTPFDIRKLLVAREEENYGEIHPSFDSSSDTEKMEFSSESWTPRYIPFSSPPVYLQERIPYHLLPETLIVHDPHGCLNAKRQSSNLEPISEDVTHIYKLSMSQEMLDCNSAERDRLQQEYGTDDQTKPLLHTPVAHLYISPAKRIGKGNHSYVYDVEWEVPRSIFYNGAEVTEEHLSDCNEWSCYHADTCTVRVAAKLSIQNDNHLAKEARNYQLFPSHLSESYTGFNCLYPIHNPVPATAVIPTFYGYYVPEKENDTTYLSPILLLEYCGKSISETELSLDDREECFTLVLRLHIAGWTHGSFYARNIVQQPGPLHKHPSLRRRDWMSFRLIDFGRAEGPTKWVYGIGKADEEKYAARNELKVPY